MPGRRWPRSLPAEGGNGPRVDAGPLVEGLRVDELERGQFASRIAAGNKPMIAMSSGEVDPGPIRMPGSGSERRFPLREVVVRGEIFNSVTHMVGSVFALVG